MENTYIKWLEARSLLYQAKQLAREISGNKIQWQHTYALPQSEQVVSQASVWFNAYPAATVTKKDQNILQFLGDEELWKLFGEIGIKALHTGPMKQAGGIVKDKYTPTVDGWFDRINLSIDTNFGNEKDYAKMVTTAAKYDGVIVGDIIPGHTGKGADFLLAVRNYQDYPGIYALIEIEQQDWELLPEVDSEWDTVNLSSETVKKLCAKGYLPGQLQRVLFLDPEAKKPVTGWDATGKIKGVDGKVRRWVYLHYFKPGQPTMNWLDPSHTAEQIIAGDIIKSVRVLQNKILRLDANPFLGIERKTDSATAWSEGHPLSVTSSNNIAQLVRKLGGWSFQELNLTLDAIAEFSKYGADLAYDFITRPALQHAVLTKDTTFLRFMYRLMQQYNIRPNSLIHGMQNHDEITYELVHFLEHSDTEFNYAGEKITGKQLRDNLIQEMHTLAISAKTPYNRLSGNGLCTTFTGLVATRLGITDIYNLSQEERQWIQKGHLLMVMFNALQPGVFEISGWDLVGALPVPLEQIQDLLKDKDYRWLNRGAYDLLKDNSETLALYGPITEQLKNPDSFVAQVKRILALREKYQIHLAEQVAIPKIKNKGAIIMLHKLPAQLGHQITALNFGDKTITETVDFNKSIEIQLEPLEGKSILIK